MTRYTAHGIRLLEGSDFVHQLDEFVNESFERIDELLTTRFTEERLNTARPGDTVFDSFTRADAPALGQAPTGQPWHSTGSQGIRARQLVTTGPGHNYATVDPGAANFEVAAEMKWVGGAGHGIVFGFRDRSNYWMAILEGRGGTDMHLRLYEVARGTTHGRAETRSVAVPPGVFARIVLTKTADTLRIQIDGEHLMRARVPAQLAGHVGMRTFADASLGQQHACRLFTVNTR